MAPRSPQVDLSHLAMEMKLSFLLRDLVRSEEDWDATPQGQWLGVDIPLEPDVLILIRPQSLVLGAEDVPLMPIQRGLISVLHALNRTLLWSTQDVQKAPADPPTDSSSYVP